MEKDTFCSPIRRYCMEQIEPKAAHDDESQSFRLEVYQGLASLGVTGTLTEEAFGGLGLSSLHYAWALEEIARVSVAYAVTISVSGLVQSILQKFGNIEQKKKYLPKMAEGSLIGAFALTEPSSGSDAASLKTKAEVRASAYALSGTKQFISNGGLAGIYMVFARTGDKEVSAFIVDSKSKGFQVGKREKKMGWRASPTVSLSLENCEVPKENLVGKLGEGMKIAFTALDSGRINIGAISLGLAERALEEATKYATVRNQFKQAIIDFQGVGFMLADMYMGVEAVRSLLYRTAQMKDQGEKFSHLAAATKCFASDQAMKITTDAVQVLGGYGYTSEYPLERFMRDAKVLQIVEGTNQIQRVVLSRHLKETFSQE